MIIIRLMGGLGNQMFQYACGRRLSYIHNVSLLLDTSSFDTQGISQDFTPRDYELNIFRLNAELAKYNITQRYHSTSLVSRLLRKINYPKIIFEKGRKLNAEVLKARSPVYLSGYWQSEKYFSDITDIIKEEFTFPEKCENNYVSELCELIKNSNSVAIHIRRGDYATNKKINSVHGLLDMDYYRRAIDLMSMELNNLTFYIFSDDPEWVGKHFFKDIKSVIINHHMPVKNYVDMKLMSYCMHNIIANSSYSWWGAWLNRNPEKVVIAPQKWYAEGNNKELMDFRVPESWILI